MLDIGCHKSHKRSKSHICDMIDVFYLINLILSGLP